jgi:hypothetical protein
MVIPQSCVSGAGFQKEFPRSAAEIERDHAVYQKRVVLAAAGPSERPPSVAQPFSAVVECFFHMRSNTRSQLAGLGGLGMGAGENANKRSP